MLWQPTTQLTTYLSYSESLSLGNEAPYWTSNGGTMLAPLLARQTEAGVKYAWSDALNLQAALYRIRQPYQFAQPDSTAAGFTFVQHGNEVHTGLELNAAGRVTDNLRLTASVNLIRARAQDTGAPSLRRPPGRQRAAPAQRRVCGLPPAVRARPRPAWRLALRQQQRRHAERPDPRAGLPRVRRRPALHQPWNGHALTWRLNVDNVFNHFYWRDTGSSGGDSYLFPGAPRLARLR